jgi:enterochelin esterase family protein
MRTIKNVLLALTITATLSGYCLGQQYRVPIISPEVHVDNTVTFRYSAPNATKVQVDAQFEEGLVEMKKDEQGVWTVTLGPVVPDMYPYSFQVDGITVMDPGNMDFFPNEYFKGSVVDVTGNTPLVHSVQTVPHGTITYELYNASSIGQNITGQMIIYTPPDYEKETSIKYPVFYCISGTSDTEEVYFKVGHLNFIMDNLIAQSKALPCIVVMPYGNPMAYLPPRPYDANYTGDLFSMMLLKDIMPFVEKNYRVINDREARAIGGFSRGGRQALRSGLSNLDKFATIISYASLIAPQEMEMTYKSLIDNPDKTNQDIKMFWLGVGNRDFLYKSAYEYMNTLSKYRINHIGYITNGGHTWMNAKLFLHETFLRMWKEFK